jgi:hypothetical protein
MPYSSAKVVSSPSESYALSPISRSGNSSRKHPAKTASTSRHSAGEALSTDTARGRPSPEAIATIFVPLPRLVGPTAKPPFWRSRRSHPRTLHPNSASLVRADVLPTGGVLRPACPHVPTAENAGGRFGTEDTCRAFRTIAPRCPESKERHSERSAYRAKGGHDYPPDAPDVEKVPPISTARLSIPSGLPSRVCRDA